MAKLYEINREIEACIDADTGEILDFERLNALQIEREEKIQGVALAIKNYLADADAIAKEKAALAEREAQYRKKVEGLKSWLTFALNGQKFSTPKCSVSFRRSVAVSIEDVASIPNEYMKIKTEANPDKDAIKRAIKSGILVCGCKLVENVNAQIK